MTFLLIVAVATLATAVQARVRTGGVPWRYSARCGLGIAFVVAGVSHLVNTTPFEQHLPGWVPAATTIIVVSGIAEIVLGCALVAARRRAPVVGLAATVFLVSVFPANVYVAVAGVDVDGLPGGLYPWLRLPLQACSSCGPGRAPARRATVPRWSQTVRPDAGRPTTPRPGPRQNRRRDDRPGIGAPPAQAS